MIEKLRKQFKEEVLELLDKLEKDLLKLEKNIEDVSLIDEIFRVMHTIKGSAGMYALEKTVNLTHKLESIYAFIRDNKTIIDINAISLTFNSIDYIRTLIVSDEKDIDTKSYFRFIQKIENLEDNLTGKNEIIEEQNNKNEEEGELDDIISLFDDEDDNENQINNKVTYYIIFRPDENINDRGINLNNILQEINDFDESKTIEHSLSQENMLKGKFYLFWEFIVCTNKPQEELDDVFVFLEDEIEIIKLSNSNLLQDSKFTDFLKDNYSLSSTLNIPKLKKTFNILQDKEINNIVEEITEKEEKKITKQDIIRQQEEITNQKTESIKVSSSRLDEYMYLVSELIVTNAELELYANEKGGEKILLIAEKLDKISQNLKENAISTRLIPIKQIMFRLERLVRDLSAELGKKINFIVEGAETKLDKNIVDNLSLPLMHIIRNAVDHGIESPKIRKELDKSETGIIRFIAFHSGTNVVIQIRDDGKGIDPELIFKKAIEKNFINKSAHLSLKEIYQLLFLPGLSTAQTLTGVSGRGVGMDAIQKSIKNLRGDIEIDSEINLGTSITIKIPQTLSIIDTMLVTISKTKFLIPVSNSAACFKIDHKELMNYPNQRLIFNKELVPFIYLREKLNISDKPPEKVNIVLVNHNDNKVALVFDEIIGNHQAVIKPLGDIFNKQDYISGGSILGDGSVALILDTYKLINQFTQ